MVTYFPQIHAEAKMEEQIEKQMIEQHQAVSATRGRDSRRASKDDWQAKERERDRDRDRDRERRDREQKADQTKLVAGILNRRKEKGNVPVSAVMTSHGCHVISNRWHVIYTLCVSQWVSCDH